MLQQRTIVLLGVLIMLMSVLASGVYWYLSSTSKVEPTPVPVQTASKVQETLVPVNHETDWACIPDVGVLAVRLNSAGNVQCLGDGTKCIYGGCDDVGVRVESLKSKYHITCGAELKDVLQQQEKEINQTSKLGDFYVGTGYDDPQHWCYKAFNALKKSDTPVPK